MSYAAFVDLNKRVQFLQKQAKMAIFVILTVFALNTWTSEGARLPNYIPTLQANLVDVMTLSKAIFA